MRQEWVCNGTFGLACLRGNLFEYLTHYSPSIVHAVRDCTITMEKYTKVLQICVFVYFLLFMYVYGVYVANRI